LPPTAEHIGTPPTAAFLACITVDFTDATHSRATAKRAAIWLRRWVNRLKITAALIGEQSGCGN
jgi:hypothetical protein